ncbi:hypothetical protein DCS_07443 [Drechmeria coniospora]|uniref:Glycophorin A domain protein n=1 Tax=Drechmeria coniospora TaxID=98403 RepID=A0A151GEF6_DRECN|nr:hypothetical protein DCS_07443 [Drechmeria coniospora]KYK55480.1 hypothetical protein DCS_07443 [Drechmeria coniospora]
MRRPRPAFLTLALAALVSASPYPRSEWYDAGFSLLVRRGCSAYCGADSQFCCNANEVCTTLANNVATCVGAGYGPYTTTWTETRTFTSTYMTNWNPAPLPTAGVDCVPQGAEQEACGSICCAGWQTCAFKGQCSIRPGYAEPSAVIVTHDGQIATRYSAPFRVTGTTTVIGRGPSTATATSTGDGTAVGADGGSNRRALSPGAIAGIVIGTLAGIGLLLLLCFCCVARGLWNALFGGADKKEERRERVEVTEERYSRHGSRVPSAYSRRDRHSGWVGSSSRPSSAGYRREKKSDGKWWLGLAGVAATLLALLNLKSDKKKPARKDMSSRYSDSYLSYTDVTSPSKSSPTIQRTVQA